MSIIEAAEAVEAVASSSNRSPQQPAFAKSANAFAKRGNDKTAVYFLFLSQCFQLAKTIIKDLSNSCLN
jgi:hypothetical protein